MLFDEGFTFRNFLVDVFTVFMFFVWIWLLVRVFSDLFRRHDVSALGKVIWVIVLIVLPYIGIFAYILTQGAGMAEREATDVEVARANLRKVVGFSAADELEKLGRLKASGELSEQEYARLRASLIR